MWPSGISVTAQRLAYAGMGKLGDFEIKSIVQQQIACPQRIGSSGLSLSNTLANLAPIPGGTYL